MKISTKRNTNEIEPRWFKAMESCQVIKATFWPGRPGTEVIKERIEVTMHVQRTRTLVGEIME